MKEATGEVSGTVITIVLIAAVLGLATWLFTGPAKNWLNNLFGNLTGECAEYDEDGLCTRYK